MKQLIFVTLLTTLIGCSIGVGQDKPKQVPTIQVVATWHDLLNQPVIELTDGTARLGIEANSCPRNSGVVLYCLTDGFSLPNEWAQSNRIGPLTVEVNHEKDQAKKRQSLTRSAWNSPPDISQSKALFRRSIPIDRTGVFHVQVTSLNGDLVAKAEIKVSDNKYHPWMPFARAREAEELEEDDGKFDAVGFVKNRSRGIAIPCFDGMIPQIFAKNNQPKKVESRLDEALPRIVPTNEQGLKIKSSGTNLIVESRKRIILARQDWHFLARWWVNNEPYIPEQVKPFRDGNGLVLMGKKLLMHIDFTPERIGAKPGDKVEVQLLYCKNGWELVQHDLERMHTGGIDDGPDLLLSNRTAIRWEKD